MPSIAVDAGPLVALFDHTDKHHGDSLTFVQHLRRPLVTNWIVLAEVAALLPARFQLDLLEWVLAGIEVDEHSRADLSRIIEIMNKYADLPADFADASIVAMCERRGIAEVATLDKHFDVYRTADRKRLRNVFLGR